MSWLIEGEGGLREEIRNRNRLLDLGGKKSSYVLDRYSYYLNNLS